MKINVAVAEEPSSGYNKIYRYQWHTCCYALPMQVIELIDVITQGRKWGWHFIPSPQMDYNREEWYKDQRLVISFDNDFDLIQSKLELSHLLN